MRYRLPVAAIAVAVGLMLFPLASSLAQPVIQQPLDDQQSVQIWAWPRAVSSKAKLVSADMIRVSGERFQFILTFQEPTGEVKIFTALSAGNGFRPLEYATWILQPTK
jgi:hypothetical protein